MSKKARRPLVGPAAKPGPGSRAAAVGFFALLPIAVALGVVVGRSGSGEGNDEALLEALRRQEAAVASTAADGPATATTGATGRKAAKAGKASGKDGGKVIATTANGPVHQVTGFAASKEKTEEDTQIVAENPAQTGENYIKAQQNLPDVTVIGGDPGAAAAVPSTPGVEP
jgi:hypothetical protein